MLLLHLLANRGWKVKEERSRSSTAIVLKKMRRKVKAGMELVARGQVHRDHCGGRPCKGSRGGA